MGFLDDLKKSMSKKEAPLTGINPLKNVSREETGAMPAMGSMQDKMMAKRMESAKPSGYGEDLDKLPARRKGGPVKKGKAYKVGEDGPEKFVPKEDGKIVPNRKARVRKKKKKAAAPEPAPSQQMQPRQPSPDEQMQTMMAERLRQMRSGQ